MDNYFAGRISGWVKLLSPLLHLIKRFEAIGNRRQGHKIQMIFLLLLK